MKTTKVPTVSLAKSLGYSAPIGRLVSRGKVAGLFVPAGDGLPIGIYEIREIMGELTIKHIGDPHMKEPRLTGLDLNGVFGELVSAAMTEEELRECGQLPKKEDEKREGDT